MEQTTIEMCVQHIVGVLEKNRINKKDINVNHDLIYFKYGDTNYQIIIEGPEDIHYGITDMDGVELDSDFWQYKDEFGDYFYIEDYLYNTVLNKSYSYVKKIWQSLDKLSENHDEEDLKRIFAVYFGLTE